MTMHTQITTDPMPWLARYTPEQSRALEDYHLGYRGAPKSWARMRLEETGQAKPQKPKAVMPAPVAAKPITDKKPKRKAPTPSRPLSPPRRAIIDRIKEGPATFADIVAACPQLEGKLIENHLTRAYAEGQIDKIGIKPMVYFIAGTTPPDVDPLKPVREMTGEWISTMDAAAAFGETRHKTYRLLRKARGLGMVESKSQTSPKGMETMWRRIEA